MDLLTKIAYGSSYIAGFQEVSIAAGTELKIETSPKSEEILKAKVPAGKAWVVKISVEVVESPA